MRPALEDFPVTPIAPVGKLSVRWPLFSFPAALAALLVLVTLLTVRGRFNDPDLWWHLKTGEIIWNTRSIPSVDLFSFTAYGHPWTAQEWLSETTIYAAWKLAGYSGLMLWLWTVSGLFILAAYLLCCLYSRNPKVAFLGGLVAWMFSTIGLSIRPHLLGYLLLVCELLILYLGRHRNKRWFFALPPLFAIWINLHSSFFFGLVVLGVVFFCSFCEFRLGLLAAHRWNGQARRTLAIALGLSVAALFINPIGPKLILYPLDVMLNQPLNLQSVAEWQPPSFDSARGFGLLLIAALVLLIPMLRGKQLEVQELILLAVGFWFAVRHERMLFVFGILTAPVLCRLLADAWDQYEPERDRFWPNAIILGIAALVAILAFPSAQNLEKQVEDGSPVKALAYIRKAGLSGRMLNEYVYGGYLIWAAPERKVFVDGRADLYEPAGVLIEFGQWATLQADPSMLLSKYHVDFCLLSREAPMSYVLPLMPGWKEVYSDKQSIVFARSQARQIRSDGALPGFTPGQFREVASKSTNGDYSH